MDKSVLGQYTDLKKEIEDEERRIRKLETELENLCGFLGGELLNRLNGI